MTAVKNIDPPTYGVAASDTIIQQALAILQGRVSQGQLMDSPNTVKDYFTVQAATHPDHEVFSVLFLDAQHRAIEFQEMFRGTVTQTSVYPREVARSCLKLNATAVILTHNHPSGSPTPSAADIELTRKLKSTLDLVDVRVLDHVITAGGSALSMAEKGLV